MDWTGVDWSGLGWSGQCVAAAIWLSVQTTDFHMLPPAELFTTILRCCIYSTSQIRMDRASSIGFYSERMDDELKARRADDEAARS